MINRTQAEAALAALGMGDTPDTATVEAITSAYRLAAKAAHPDAPGGSPEAFVAVDRAKHVLLKWLERGPTPQMGVTAQHTECPHCGGTGFIRSHRGFGQMRVQCPRCKGTGEVE